MLALPFSLPLLFELSSDPVFFPFAPERGGVDLQRFGEVHQFGWCFLFQFSKMHVVMPGREGTDRGVRWPERISGVEAPRFAASQMVGVF